jgi:hypothetical protein
LLGMIACRQPQTLVGGDLAIPTKLLAFHDEALVGAFWG